MAKRAVNTPKRAEAYQHDEQAVVRPKAGTQAHFKKRRKHKRYRHNNSLSPALDWDGQNPVREFGGVVGGTDRRSLPARPAAPVRLG